jgi:xylulokinase
MTLLLGIDLGTASSKGVLATPDGEIVATATRPRPRSMSMPHPGWAEVDAEGVWWADVVALCRELAGRVPPGESVAALTVSGVGPCLVLTDDAGRPVRPAILYGIDMRATEEIAELEERYGADEVLARAGTPLTTQAVGPKALWVRRHEPEVWERARRWFSASSYVVWHLTGQYVLDHHTASQCVPLYDLAAEAWHDATYSDLMDPLPRPRLAWSAEVVGTLTGGAAEATGLPEGTPVCAGTVDAWAEAFSAGVRQAGDLMLMYGSTMFLVQELEQPSPHPQLWNTAGVAPGSRSLAAGMATSGSLTEWVRELTGGVDFGTLVEEAARVPAGSEGLLLLPYFAGERTPIFDRHARGVVAGLTLQHTRGHLFRAAYEGIGFGIRQILALLDTDANPVRRLVAVGGGTQGRLWTQVVSDITGRVQEVPEQTIGASYGDALMAGIGAGLLDPSTDWARTGTLVEPDPSVAELYAGLFEAYTDLYPATLPQVHQLARLSPGS